MLVNKIKIHNNNPKRKEFNSRSINQSISNQMSALLKEVLALTVKNEAALWKAVEQKVLSGLPTLATPELV